MVTCHNNFEDDDESEAIKEHQMPIYGYSRSKKIKLAFPPKYKPT